MPVLTDRPVNAADIRVFVMSSAGGNPADGNHILIAGKTGIADVDIVADDIWIGTRVSAYGGIEIASAILKRRAPTAVLLLPLVLVCSANEPTAVLLVPLSLLTMAAVPRALFPVPAVLSKRAAVPTAVLESELLSTSAPAPTPVLKLPVLVPNSAYQPSPVFAAPAGEVTQRVASFRRRETGIATVRRRTECLRFGQERKAAKRQNY